MLFSVLILIILFVMLLLTLNFYPAVTLWDKSFIIFVQTKLVNLPLWIPMLIDCSLYTAMIILPLVIISIYFFRKKLYFNILLLCSMPLTAYILNCIVKNTIKRHRPPFEMQQLIHPESFSFVSSHSLVTFCLYGLIIFFIQKYCKNKLLKISIIIISVLWILFVGLSRIWLGVHYPTDVVSAYILGCFLLICYIKIFKKFEAGNK